MECLEKLVFNKIQDIVEKLQKMDCILLGNRDDSWIMELLFQTGFHRYHLMEWILTKLECDVREMSGPRNSEEERMKNLQVAVADLGICRKKSYNIVKGTAPMKDQLQFWCILVNMLWTQYQITTKISLTETDEGVDLSETDCASQLEKNKRRHICDEFEDASFCISNILESVNLRHLLQHDLQLLAPDVEMEANKLSNSEMDQFISLQNLKELVRRNPPTDFNSVYKSIQSQNAICIIENLDDIASENELNQLENSMLETSTLIQDYAQGKFTEVYNELKLLILSASSEEFTDVGPHFQKVEKNLEALLELKKSFPKLESSHLKLLKISSELEGLSSNEKMAGSQTFDIASLSREN